MRLVLVHGILDTGSKFDAMRRFLEPKGVECFTPSLTPSDGRCGLDKLAEQLAEKIDQRFGSDAPFALLGFSMGGMVSRWYLQELGGYERVQRFFVVSSPLRGSAWSYLYPGVGAAQMRPGSAFLDALKQSEAVLDGMPIHSYWTPFDLVIIPPDSSVWERAENTRILAACHPCMLHSRQLKEDVYAKLSCQTST